ncbi:methyltransferase domain-containing protein [Desulfovibrio psychrotolerans]|uniref:Methyltransferase domain-containing protein n=1 Tax=Desulfovibrio psychrotolerans TaxID=415242 RepID=A0A7J0BXW6_9BACT|nr:methyltransferase domain-containing protein [Desulfovibrio psychrotolerans]GFM38540.1 hypothetical protein DSM19430T_32240 [Desulfovibrio psychrotolerans]
MIYWFNPQSIQLGMRVELPIGRREELILDGDWDKDVMPFEKSVNFYGSFKQRLSGVPWEETEYFKKNVDQIESGMTKWGCKDREEFLTRCYSLEKVYVSIKDNGYIQIGDVDCISIALDRYGRPLFCNGRHRLSIAKLLNLPSVPVRILARHRNWVDFCNKVDAYAQSTVGKVYAPLAHPDLIDRGALHKARTQHIIENMLPSSQTVMDIGSHWGYLPTLIEQTGRHCVAVEQSQRFLYFMNGLRKANGLSFDVVSEDVFRYVGTGKKFDTVLALAIFHHFLKTEEQHEALRTMLRNLEMEELFLLTHAHNEAQMRGAYVNYAPEEFAQFIVDNSCLDWIVPLASFDGRVLYRIGKKANEHTYLKYDDDFKIVFFAFANGNTPHILDKVNGQFKGLRSCHPNSMCVVMGEGSDDVDVSRYDFNYIDLRHIPDGCQNKGSIAVTLLRKLAPDVVYMRYSVADEHLVLLCRSIPNIILEHQTKELDELIHLDKDLYLRELAMGTPCLHRAAGIVGVTPEIARYERARSGGRVTTRAMGNGIAPDAHPLSKRPKPAGRIEGLVVAEFRYWHGLDRLIAGFAAAPSVARKMLIHVVGSGAALEGYRDQICACGLEDCFVFHGALTPEQVDPLADRCAFAVGVLAPGRKRLTETAALQHREYALRGLPFLFAGSDVDFLARQPFCHVIPDDESPVDMLAMLGFAKQALQKPALRLHAREYALQNLDWAVKMQIPVSLCRYVMAKNHSPRQSVADGTTGNRLQDS